MGKISIKKSELNRIIKEEALKFKKALTLKGEFEKINGELNKLNENEGISEVTAGEVVPSKGLPYEGGQHKPKFATKNGNPNLKMEDEEEITDTDVDIDNDTDVDADSNTVSKADLIKAIDDLKIALNLNGSTEVPSEEAGEETTEEPDSEVASNEEGNKEDEEDGDEIFEFEEEGQKSECGAPMEEKKITETLEEPIEGKSVVQNADQDKVNDNMEKDTHVNESESLMETEKKRMAQLAGIIKG